MRNSYDQEALPMESQEAEASLMKISWSNLQYTVRAGPKRWGRRSEMNDKVLLKPQSGYIKPGQTCFIMGSSGAGKTTLLNTLCGRITSSSTAKVEGQVMINDTYPITQKDFGKYGAYVMQDDVLFPTFTCEEVITFSAKLKLNLSEKEIKNRVSTIIDDLRLNNCKNTFVGNQLIKGISGGQRKRTAIAIEMVTDPQVLFLDEPTSGLDSFTANRIVKLLVKQARLGKTIVATIHQPSSQTFNLFDKLILLMDGNQIYQGPADKSVGYFESIGYSVPSYSNPADYFLMKFYLPYKKSERDIQMLETLKEAFEEKLSSQIALQNEAEYIYEEITAKSLSKAYSQISFWSELKELVKRTGINIYRNPTLAKMRFFSSCMITITICFFFWDLGYDPKGIHNKRGFMFYISWNQTFQSVLSVVMNFIDERPVFLREYAAKTYRIWSYFLSKSLVEAPFQLLFPILTSLSVYFLVGLTPDVEKLMIFTLILLSVVFCATSLGFAIGCCVEEPYKGTSLTIFILGPIMFFGGHLVNLNTVPTYIRWMNYLSPVRYATEALLRNELEGNRRYSLSQDFFSNLGFDLGMAECILILVVLGLAFRVLGALLLRLAVTSVQ
ncbi:unnamed protein product [Moneuplotes crassus]|uniref:ABC transporter domain-containing protein n=1 Tax=Euplotes crassus TaxID=5936 RepID=A0AAD1X8Y7_EUPCR|nr:unnamed protein product [Moneuplotes crassus]